MDSSFILMYYNPSQEAASAWYPVPGLGPGGTYEARSFAFQSSTSPSVYTFGVRLTNPTTGAAYNVSQTWTKLRIFVVPATSISFLMLDDPDIDLSDYHAVTQALGVGGTPLR